MVFMIYEIKATWLFYKFGVDRIYICNIVVKYFVVTIAPIVDPTYLVYGSHTRPFNILAVSSYMWYTITGAQALQYVVKLWSK